VDGDEPNGIAGNRRSAPSPAVGPFAARSAIAPALASFDHGSPPGSVRLFDPNRILTGMVVLFWPLRFFPIVLIPAVLLAALTMFKHWHAITADLQQLLGRFSFIIGLLLNLLVVNLVARLSMGAVVRASGIAVRDFGFMFFLGFIPRFYIDRSAIPRLDRNRQLWANGAPLMVRLGFFAFGMLAWATSRSSGTWLASYALLLSQAGLWAFLFAIIPFLPGDGYHWLAAYFRQPMLRERALIALTAKLRGRRLPPGFRSGKLPVLIMFGIGIMLAISALAVALLIVWTMLLTDVLQGMGAVISLVLVAGFVTWLLSFKARPVRQTQQSREIRLLQAVMAAQTYAAEPEPAPKQRRTPRLMIWAGIGVAMILASFLPYSYDPGGPFEILSTQRSKAMAATDGEVVDVIVHEGDRVSAGQVLAHLLSSDQQRDINLTRQELERAEARLARLDEKRSNLERATAEPKGIGAADRALDAAQNDVERLRHQLAYDKAGLERTTIRAPGAGLVVTPEPRFLTGVWLNAGDEFLQIDDTSVVEAEIEIPEGDIALVKPGAKVRLRPWSGSQELVGHITALAPTALDKTDKSVIRVKASVPNEEMLLRPLATTGYAKINGVGMTIGEAYFRLFNRFLTVEIWSWVP
jgi:RND family efflux transporter MFP subunit